VPVRLTPFERLITTSIGGLMGQRRMFTRHGKKRHGLKTEDMAVLVHVRLAKSQGKVVTATSLVDDLLMNRRTLAGTLQRLVKKGLIIARAREGKEVVYENPPGYVFPAYLIDDILVDLVTDQIVRGAVVTRLVAQLDDLTVKQKIDAAVNVAEMAAFYLT
jgi:hypothetical protein